MLDVSIILVSYNTKDLTRACIKSVIEKTEGLSYDIWVVDNNSSDNSCEMIKQEFPHVHLIENKENLLKDFILKCDTQCQNSCKLYNCCMKKQTDHLATIVNEKLRQIDLNSFKSDIEELLK